MFVQQHALVETSFSSFCALPGLRPPKVSIIGFSSIPLTADVFLFRDEKHAVLRNL